VWDPVQYRRFGSERARPFFDLLARVQADQPRYVVDLGCGSGELTAELASRWPGATVLGVDNSPAMIGAARERERPRLSFVLGDVTEWEPAHPVDVLISNAVLQWVPGHASLLPRWAGALSRGGWLAFQVPGNFDQPGHVIAREMAASPRWRPLLRDVRLNRQATDPGAYLETLAGAGCEVDAWETTYLHVLHGEDPVVEWYKGTGLRPVLAALDEAQAREFLAEYGQRVREAYPPRPFGTVLPFRRVFVAARRTWHAGA
jgi:trans-aconitate 2-methyltransferase